MNLATYKLIAPALNAEITAVLKKHGLDLRRLNAGIDDRLGEVKITITCADANLTVGGVATTPERERFKGLCRMFPALRAEWLDSPIKIGADKFKLVGAKNTRSDKCILLLKEGETRSRICSISDLERMAVNNRLTMVMS